MRKRSLVPLVLFLIFLACLPALAEVDSEGVALRDRLKALVQAEDLSAFRELAAAEPELSKRAFIAEFLDVWEKRDGENSFPPLTELAELLSEEIVKAHSDVKPSQIVDRYRNRKFDVACYELARYAEDIHPPYEEAPIVESLNVKNLEEEIHYGAGVYRRADFGEGELYVLLPLILNHIRLELASAYLDRRIFVQELEHRLKASSLATDRMKEALGDPDLDEWEKSRRQTEEMLTLLGQSFLVRTGLVSDFDAVTMAKLGTLSVEHRLPAIVSRFQAALRESRIDDARAFLATTEELIAENSEDPPALYRFVLQTMRFQVRPDQQTLSADEVLRSFSSAWDKLDEYIPGVRVTDDEG